MRAASQTLADRIAAEHPDTLTTEWRKEKRDGKILVDVARNTYGQTVVAAYAVRGLRGAPVSAPVTWDEVADPSSPRRPTRCARWPTRLAAVGDPWADINEHAATLPKDLTALDMARHRRASSRYRRGMGFLDKAKKLAEQAQTKLDEVQSQINTQGSRKPPGGPVVEYDKHGRPIPQQQPRRRTVTRCGPRRPPRRPAPTLDPSAPPAHGDPRRPAARRRAAAARAAPYAAPAPPPGAPAGRHRLPRRRAGDPLAGAAPRRRAPARRRPGAPRRRRAAARPAPPVGRRRAARRLKAGARPRRAAAVPRRAPPSERRRPRRRRPRRPRSRRAARPRPSRAAPCRRRHRASRPGPSGPPAEGEAPPPAMPGAPPSEEDRNRPSYAPPKLSSGDPLAG